MTKIYKYPIGLGMTDVEIPFGAKVISAKLQHGHPCVWAIIENDNTEELRTFGCYATGEEFDLHPRTVFIDTISDPGNSFIFHVFEIPQQ